MGELFSSLVNKSSYIDPKAVLASLIEALIAAPEEDVAFRFCKKPKGGCGSARGPEVVTLSEFVLDGLQNAQEDAPCGQICSITPQLLRT
jgi:hypothetical protein